MDITESFIIYESFERILDENASTTTTNIINPQSKAPASGHLNPDMANSNGAPIPPAPTRPSIDAFFTFISKR